MKNRHIFLVAGLIGVCAMAQAQESPDVPEKSELSCESGPLKKTFGKTPWYVYGCDDGRSIVVVTAPGNPAMPFYFSFVWGPNGFELHGEGAGSKEITDAAYEELKVLTEADVTQLHNDAASAGDRS
jgi:hypothetical protein